MSQRWDRIASEDRTMEGIFGILLAATGLVGPLGPATGLVGPLGPRRAAQLSASRQAGVWLMATGPPIPLAGPPSEKVWNAEISAAWARAYTSADGEHEYEISEISGQIPSDLRGTIFRNGPGNFERNGERFAHVLDGDGLLLRFSIDGASGRARFKSRFVETPQYEAEKAADAVLHRNTFGTQPPGLLRNVLRMGVKNVANTNVQRWGGKTLALWEAAAPCSIDPETLAYQGVETFGGLLSEGTLMSGVSTGSSAVDGALGVGRAFTAHPRVDRSAGAVVGWSWAAPIVGDKLSTHIYEWDVATGELMHTTVTDLPSP